MQPTLVLSAPQAGILYLNGHFAGEVSQALPLLRPVNGQGALYLDYRPLSNQYLPMARKLVFSVGMPMEESVENAEDLNIILWPGGTIEIELLPEAHRRAPLQFELSSHNFTLDAGELICDGRRLAKLPTDAQLPELHSLPEGNALLGKIDDEQYLLTLDAAFTQQSGFLRARQIELEPDGRIRAVTARGDLVGHATLENWKLSSEGLMLLSSEPAWLNGQALWPNSPDKTARALLEASLAELDGEAEIYLSPALRSHNLPALLRQSCDLCVNMRYAPPDPRPCVALMRLLSDRYARISPLYYHASPSGGPQGPWQIDEIEWE